MNPVLHIGLHHFVIVSFLLMAAGVATMLTKRNAIGILIGVELVLNAAAINFVAFNRYGWPVREQTLTSIAQLQPGQSARFALKVTSDGAAVDAKGTVIALRTDDPSQPIDYSFELDAGSSVSTATTQPAALLEALNNAEPMLTVRQPAVSGNMFAIFIIVLAAAEAAVALAIILNYYNNFSSIDVEKANSMKG